MTFISYAQNYEDVMLYRALQHIEKGFYVDVGAFDPIIESVTHAFYERNWQGINIEPVHLYYENFCSARPLDINLPIAVADKEGDLTFYEIPETGLSTLDQKTAEIQRKAGWDVTERKISVLTLNQILEKYVNGPIHFLKIDVEGAEKQVLQGLDLSRWRPWILVIEATMPLTQEQNYDTWEYLITEVDYIFVYFDGLNRFYLAKEKSELMSAFKTPPGYFDDFIRVNEWNALTASNAKEAERQDIEETLNAKEAEIYAIYTRASWKITAPARFIKSLLRAIVNRTKTMFKNIIVWMVAKVLRHPSLKSKAISFFNNYPYLKNRLKKLASAPAHVHDLALTRGDGHPNLSFRAQKIYNDLLDAIEQNKSER